MWRHTGRVLRALPFTVAYSVSLLGFMVAMMLQPSPWAWVVFYVFALPYYLVTLVLVALSVTTGFPGHWTMGLALCIAFDAFVVRPLMRRMPRV